MKRNVFFLLMILLPVIVNAYDAEIDGIYYSLDSSNKTATVIKNYSLIYSGDVVIPSNVTFEGVTYTVVAIGSAFYNSNLMTSITIPSSVTSIGGNAFYQCIGLTSINIPSSVTSIGNNAFSGCTGLTSIIVDGENNKYDSRENCNAIIETSSNKLVIGCQNTIIPSSVISIGSYAFAGCAGITSINIPENVTSIGDEAFYGCTDLTSITIYTNNIGLGSRVFSNCYRINTIYCLSQMPPYCGSQLFISNDLRDKYDIYTYATLHVPMGSKELYSSAYEWRYFDKIKEDMEANGKVYYANLTVKQGTVGYTRQAVKAAETYTIYIGSLGDNKVNTVLFNGVDVTSSIVNGYYTTPEIKGESEISISFESETSVKSMQVDNLKVSGYNGEIRVQNIEKPSDIYVYSVDGKLVNSALSTIGSSSIQVASDQLYLVKVGNRTFKVAL